MFDITITAETPEDLRNKVKALASLLTGTVLAVGAVPSTAVEDAPDATVALKAAPKVKVTPAKAKPEPVEEPTEARLLDFNTEVAPTVIAMVNEHGKPFVSEVLEQFGVGKASEMAPELWPELLAALEAAAA